MGERAASSTVQPLGHCYVQYFNNEYLEILATIPSNET